MPKKNSVIEEPFDIDLEEDEEFKFDFEDEDEEIEAKAGEVEDDDEDEEHLDDEDLDAYKQERDEARQAAAEARQAAADLRAEREQRGHEDVTNQIKAKRDELTKLVAGVKAKLKAAFDEADADAHVSLTEELAELKGQERLLSVLEEQQKNRPQTQQRPQPHAKATAWVARNKWFTDNEEARMAAVAFSTQLEKDGITPDQDQYYTKVDAHMRRRYPELYEKEDDPPAKKRRKPPPVTSGAREEGGAESNPKKRRVREVRLTPLQLRMAKSWGVSKEDYAKEVLKLQRIEERNQ